jgi:hypothetical protein
MGLEGRNNAPTPKKGVKETLQKLARLAAFGAALTGAPAETKAMDTSKMPISENVIDKRGIDMNQEDLANIAMNPNFDIMRMASMDPVIKEVLLPPKNTSPLDTKMKPPSIKKPQAHPSNVEKKLPPSIGW